MNLGVLLDRLDGSPGGAEAHTAALLRRAVAQGERVVLATMRGRAPEGIETIRIPAKGGRPGRDEAFAREGVRRLREAGCDVVFAIRHAPDCDVYLPHGGLVDDARRAKDRAGGGPGPWRRVARAFGRKHAWFQQVEQTLLSRESGPTVIAVADHLAARLRQRHPACAGRVETVHNGVDAEHFQRAASREAGAALRARLGLKEHLVGLLLARHPVLKGLETAIRALACGPVRALERPFVLLVAGGSVPRRLRRLARRLGVGQAVHALGPLHDPRPLYAAADLLVHPTWYDPCSLVCLEALAMEIPVITTPDNGVCEIMRQRGGIVLEGPGDPQALAVALRVLADDDLRAVTARDARDLAVENPERASLDRILALCRHASDAGLR